MNGGIAHAQLVELAGHHRGIHDIPCPLCGPSRRSPANRGRKVLRIWRVTPTFATYRCARCDARGYVHERGAVAPDRATLAAARAEARRFAAVAEGAKRRKAAWLWNQRCPIGGTIAERYLREVRVYGGVLPSTIGFLPARGNYHPAMISAFGTAAELEPGVLSVAASDVHAVHLTKLASNGLSKAGTENDKIMIGTPRGAPIVVAAPTDLLGLAIGEGIEDALSVHEATGLGVWAAGAASFLPALADAVPTFIESVTIIVDDDPAGRRNADELAKRLDIRGVEVRLVIPAVRGLAG